MDILRNLFGSLTSGIIRLLVTVGILAAAYFFLVKPVLETTSEISKEANSSFQKSIGGQLDLGDIGGTIESVNKQVERQIRRSFHTAEKKGHPNRLIRCIKRAEGDVQRIKRCTVKF
jgi:hypothetical protein